MQAAAARMLNDASEASGLNSPGREPESGAASLDLSVLIATRNRALCLRETLRSMCRLQCEAPGEPPVRWELVIVDNGSTDDTAQVLAEFTTLLPLRSGYVGESGQNRARNSALADLRGRVTVLSDDDVSVAPDWLLEWRRGIARWPAASVFGGQITPSFPAGTPDWISGARFPFRAQCFAAFAPRQGEGGYAGTPFGPNFAVRTEVLREAAFREDLGPASDSYAVGGETELVMRLQRQGHTVVYLPLARVQHRLAAENLDIGALLRRAFNAGRGDEYRRALRRGWGPGRMRLRAALELPLKVFAYRLWCRLGASAEAAEAFRRRYKLQSALGRQEQLRRMLAVRNVP
jgi:glycosyltransferase involved in cell wall biosynthesis